MLVDVSAVRAALQEDHLDGWLLYDFHGSNPIAAQLVGLGDRSKITTRRWYYLIPAVGQPKGLVHVIEPHTLDSLPGKKNIYGQHRELQLRLQDLVIGCKTIAMEYSPNCAIPSLSRVDAGTIETIRQLGVEVVSSGDLVQRFQVGWNSRVLALHQEAATRLYRVKDRAFNAIADLSLTGSTEFEIQQLMVEWLREEGLITDSPPVVASQQNAGHPHYQPTVEFHRSIGENELVLLDLWGKLDEPDAVFADITWMGYTGPRVPKKLTQVFATACDARDAAIEFVQTAAREQREVRGWQVDHVAREIIDQAGYGNQFIHRTGHSLGEKVHGNGVHMDDYETHDNRRLLPGTGFTIEPGIYFDRFGVRTEINMYFGELEATVTGPIQTDIVTLR